MGRQLFLGDNLDAGRLEASFDQGILTLTVPVAGQAKPRRIQVGTRSQGPQPVETTGDGQASTADQPGSSAGAP
jgi:HSP20 family protein